MPFSSISQRLFIASSKIFTTVILKVFKFPNVEVWEEQPDCQGSGPKDEGYIRTTSL
ncbi:hypothetical protein HanXRQr2_Chr15g0718891 [Helianthus annuus]|uniref:Uncharacterized protein n=1 Tax=Helianthus annuus TaxID=4232 RepID=A0A251SDJ2_HELAN|nr:hypothetical protein HanXRQr2_Chr15g0718891 [Helianthus annuus]KAJ0833379.1 hypothetical protein HanPSC8_Chr15g0689711 [Helianthus annuus]